MRQSIKGNHPARTIGLVLFCLLCLPAISASVDESRFEPFIEKHDVGWIDYVGATVTDLGNGKVRVTVAGGTDPNAIHDNAAGEIVVIPSVTVAPTDVLIIEDASDGYQKKSILASDLLGGGGGG